MDSSLLRASGSENLLSHLAPVQCAGVVQIFWPELVPDYGQGGLPDAVIPVALIRVHHRGAQFAKEIGNRRLATAYSRR